MVICLQKISNSIILKIKFMNISQGAKPQTQTIKFLSKLGLIDNQFDHLDLGVIRQASKFISHMNPLNQIKQKMQILKQKYQSPEQFLKGLMWIHNLAQEGETFTDQIYEKLLQDLNDFLNFSRNSIQRSRKKLSKSSIFSLGSTVSWLKEKMGSSKQKNIKGRSIKRMQSLGANKTLITSESEVSDQFQSKEEFLYHNIILPYAKYVQKMMCNRQFSEYVWIKNLKNQEVWKLINSFKCLFKICQNVNTVMRYFEEEYLDIVIFLVKVIDFDFKMCYPVLESTIRAQVNILTKEQIAVQGMEVSDGEKKNMIETIIQKYEVAELKEIVQEMSTLNDHILQLYFGKYHYPSIKGKVKCVKLMKISPDFDIVHEILQNKEKKKSPSKSGKKINQLSTLSLKKLKRQMALNQDFWTPQLKKKTKLVIQDSEGQKSPVKKNDSTSPKTHEGSQGDSNKEKGNLNRLKQIRMAVTKMSAHKNLGVNF